MRHNQHQQLCNASIEEPIVLGRFQDEFLRIDIKNIICSICSHSSITKYNDDQDTYEFLFHSKPTSFTANINPKYYLNGVGTRGRLKMTQLQDSQFSYQIHDSKAEELMVDGNITEASQDIKSVIQLQASNNDAIRTYNTKCTSTLIIIAY